MVVGVWYVGMCMAQHNTGIGQEKKREVRAQQMGVSLSTYVPNALVTEHLKNGILSPFAKLKVCALGTDTCLKFVD